MLTLLHATHANYSLITCYILSDQEENVKMCIRDSGYPASQPDTGRGGNASREPNRTPGPHALWELSAQDCGGRDKACE